MAAFEQWYRVYPCRKAKAKAERAWLALKPDAELQATIHTAVARQKQARADALQTGQWQPDWPHPATWINGRRWEDQGTTEVEVTPQPPTFTLLENLWYVMAFSDWRNLLSCDEPNGDGVVRLLVGKAVMAEPFKAKLEAKLAELRPGARLEIVEASS